MKTPALLPAVFLLVLSLAGCGTKETTKSVEMTPMPTRTSAVSPTNPGESGGLFIDTDLTREVPEEAHIVRSRFVKINLDLLLDEAGQTRDVKEIIINLFPDVTYTGVIELMDQNGDSISWSGYLKDVEYSYFTMVYTSGAFMGHFASPLGIYETAFVEGDLYRVIMIDQTKLPGGEG